MDAQNTIFDPLVDGCKPFCLARLREDVGALAITVSWLPKEKELDAFFRALDAKSDFSFAL